MSDGPYKTLPMKPRWKIVAKAAFLDAYEVSEVAKAMEIAVMADYRAEVSDSFGGAISQLLVGTEQIDLFPDHQLSGLDALHVRCGSPIETSLLLNAKQAVIDGLTGGAAMQQAIEDTLVDRCLSASRQVEEHMYREASSRRADIVRLRMGSAVGNAAISRLAHEILGSTSTPVRMPHPRYDGLDDGVRL